MCGIVAYVGFKDASPILLEGLRRLEYRGYDSAGISVLGSDNALSTVKKAGKLKELEAELLGKMPGGFCGIGHTRWATHGAPTTLNAHPHSNESGDISLVHNGIIENSAHLRRRLIEAGYRFYSDTDTEAVVHLIDEAYRESDTLEAAVISALHQVEGTFGIAAISSRDPNKLVVARNGSPLVIGIGDSGENLAGSDVSSVIQHTKDVVYLDDGDCAVLTPDDYKILHL
ncbi:MAG TPA: glutamine--fructose-6-phosphate aminotransferase, partial [Gemmatimonadetes bacterium]|nr:glutamine--fructose-6-phosphate aminotransferase [Gemmatimonadota bacterium]